MSDFNHKLEDTHKSTYTRQRVVNDNVQYGDHREPKPKNSNSDDLATARHARTLNTR